MLVSAYDAFVDGSDRSLSKPLDERRDIAIYGLAGEVGSVVAAIKKRLLSEGGPEPENSANAEIVEELGDLLWYSFSLAHIENCKQPVNVFAHDIENLKREIGAGDARAARIGMILDPEKREEFLKKAEDFPECLEHMEFEDYQHLAFLTARTRDRTLVEVCLAVLSQLSAELFRPKLPPFERELNKSVADRPTNDVLGEILWHISALASIYQLQLSEIAERNREKLLSFRVDREHPTPLHDTDYPVHEQLPHHFEVGFITVGAGRSRMYFNGHSLGDDLTDNSYKDDGYRYHDIMHLANAAKLGWSPVLRALLSRKRRSNRKIDEVEDGARAMIVEEAVIKAIHAEGERLATLQGRFQATGPVRLFASPEDITFRFLKFIRNFVADLEVEKNLYWEWGEAILSGYEVFHQLRCEGQGTVIVDLDARSITFRPEVHLDLNGKIAGLGSAYIEEASAGGLGPMTGQDATESEVTRLLAQKLAILDALGVRKPDRDDLNALEIKEIEGRGISVKATGSIRSLMWDHKVVAFQTTGASTNSTGGYYCTAVAISDD